MNKPILRKGGTVEGTTTEKIFALQKERRLGVGSVKGMGRGKEDSVQREKESALLPTPGGTEEDNGLREETV